MSFLRESVGYFGHIIEVKAIREAPAPTNVKELHSFLGLVNYCEDLLRI